MARSLGITKVFRTSVKEDLNVLTVFTQLAQEYLTSYLALDDLKTNELIEEDAFLATIESHGLVSPEADKPHHKFHTPVFGHFRTNAPTPNKILLKNNKNNKGHMMKLISSNKGKDVKSHQDRKSLISLPPFHHGSRALSPIIHKGHLPQQPIADELVLMKGLRSFTSSTPQNNKNYRKIGRKDPQYFFSASGNHYTHWENMPFRLEDSHKDGHHFRKQKKELCNIL